MLPPTYSVSHQAYLKIFFHAAKHPHKPVNGVLVGKPSGESGAVIVDAIPLLHNWTSLSPMMEIGLDLAGRHAKDAGLMLVGYYQACERLDDRALAPVGEKVASKLRESFKDAVAFVIDGEKLGTGEAALIPYFPTPGTSTSWQRVPATPEPFSTGSSFRLSSEHSPKLAVGFVRDEHLHHKFGDFDDHLEDVTIDWLQNKACMPSAE
jgi:hypothetical protein